MPQVKLGVGVVCSSGRRPCGAGARSDSYVVAGGGRLAWLEGAGERTERAPGEAWLLAAIDGDVAPDGTCAAARVAREVGRLVGVAHATAEPTRALVAHLADVHTRLYWERRAAGASSLGASVAAAWVVRGVLHWAELGTARVCVVREGRAHRLAKDWALGDTQRVGAGSRGLGDDTAVHLRPGVNAGRVKLYAGDQIVVATDGFWRAVDEASAAALLAHVADPQAAAVASLERAMARGADDEITVLVGRVDQVAAEALSSANRPVEPSSRHRRASTVP